MKCSAVKVNAVNCFVLCCVKSSPLLVCVKEALSPVQYVAVYFLELCVLKGLYCPGGHKANNFGCLAVCALDHLCLEMRVQIQFIFHKHKYKLANASSEKVFRNI